MFRTALLTIGFSAMLTGFSQAQSPFPGGERYDGTVRIVELTGRSCPPGQEGEVFPAVFRAQLHPDSAAGEMLSLAVESLAGALFLQAEGDGTLAGRQQPASGTFILDAHRGVLPQAILNLDFRPNRIDGDVDDFTMNGTVRNYTFRGCTARIRGAFVRRGAR